MTIDKQKVRSALADWIGEQDPYAATTIQFLTPGSGTRSDSSLSRELSVIKSRIKDMAFRADHLFMNTKQVVNRVARVDRFEAVCVVEKLGVHAHVHMAWFSPEKRRSRWHLPIDRLDRQLRQCCVLETFNRGNRALEDRDVRLLDKFRERRDCCNWDDIVDWDARGWPAFSASIGRGYWPTYITKEMQWNNDFTDQMFFLSEFHPPVQRTKPTRYHKIDGSSWLLDLDALLVPK